MGVPGSEIALSRNDGVSSYGEITTIAESPLDPRVLWVGSDDGNLQVSRDGGATWSEVSRNVRGVPAGTYVSRVIASVTGAAVAYATFDAHRDGDFAPYVFKTDDFGRSWRSLTAGLPAEGSVNVIREHPANPDLLLLGTEHALFVSLDGADSWMPFMPNLPTTLYDDLVIHPRDNDLIVATHGRSLWILDDIAPLSEWSDQVKSVAAHLFSIRPTIIYQYWKDTSYRGQAAFAGTNPVEGAIISFHLTQDVDSASLTISNDRGQVVRRLTAPGTAGVIQRVNWDLRHEPPPSQESGAPSGALPVLPRPTTPRGPFVSPGIYTVTLDAGGASAARTVEVRSDPLLSLTAEQWREREDFLTGLLGMQDDVWGTERRANELERATAAERDAASEEDERLEALKVRADSVSELTRRLRRLRIQIYGLAGAFNGSGVRQGSLQPPTLTHYERRDAYAAALQALDADSER
jgi:hypothetical protein